jgi:hypothetical protein
MVHVERDGPFALCAAVVPVRNVDDIEIAE